jgi:arylsulfatase A-like enzyme
LVLLLALVSVQMATRAAATQPPNIVFILSDDQTMSLFQYMPKMQARMASAGKTFAQYITSNPVCSSSRATTLTGRYSHNTNVWNINDAPSGPGVVGSVGAGTGYSILRAEGLLNKTIGVYLQEAGYTTHMSGKFINGYPNYFSANYTQLLSNDLTYVPAGWDDWHVSGTHVGQDEYAQYNYYVNDNGTVVYHGNSTADYGTDVVSGSVNAFIRRAAASGEPFFAYTAVFSPHTPSVYPDRYSGATFTGSMPTGTPDFNQANVTLDPRFWQVCKLLNASTVATMQQTYLAMQRCVLAIDDLIDGVYAALADTGVLNNTYVFFASDNGYTFGGGRIESGKMGPREDILRGPLYVTGPGIAAGAQDTSHLVSNMDLFATWLELAGAWPWPSDGYSLVPLLHGSPTSTWREALLIEHGTPGDVPTVGALAKLNSQTCLTVATVMPSYAGLRTTRYTYVEYEDGVSVDLYDLAADPYEVNNLQGSPAYACVRGALHAELAVLKNCTFDACRPASALVLSSHIDALCWGIQTQSQRSQSNTRGTQSQTMSRPNTPSRTRSESQTESRIHTRSQSVGMTHSKSRSHTHSPTPRATGAQSHTQSYTQTHTALPTHTRSHTQSSSPYPCVVTNTVTVNSSGVRIPAGKSATAAGLGNYSVRVTGICSAAQLDTGVAYNVYMAIAFGAGTNVSALQIGIVPNGTTRTLCVVPNCAAPFAKKYQYGTATTPVYTTNGQWIFTFKNYNTLAPAVINSINLTLVTVNCHGKSACI